MQITKFILECLVLFMAIFALGSIGMAFTWLSRYLEQLAGKPTIGQRVDGVIGRMLFRDRKKEVSK